MSPEQAQGFPVDARSDIFSFGIVLYQMLARVHPFEAVSKAGIMANILRSQPRPLTEVSPDMPAELEEVVQFCLRKEPEDRAHSMHDVARMLEMAEKEMERPSVGATPGAETTLVDGRRRRHRSSADRGLGRRACSCFRMRNHHKWQEPRYGASPGTTGLPKGPRSPAMDVSLLSPPITPTAITWMSTFVF